MNPSTRRHRPQNLDWNRTSRGLPRGLFGDAAAGAVCATLCTPFENHGTSRGARTGPRCRTSLTRVSPLLPAARLSPMGRVVVTGLGAVTPLGNDARATWDAAVAGRSGIDFITAFDASEFPVRIAAEVKGFDGAGLVGPKEAR